MFNLDVKEGQQLWAHKHNFKSVNGRQGLYYEVYAAGPHILTQKKYDDKIELFMCGIPIKTYWCQGNPRLSKAKEDVARWTSWGEIMYGVTFSEWISQERVFWLNGHYAKHLYEDGVERQKFVDENGNGTDDTSQFYESNFDYKVDKCILHSEQYIIKSWSDNNYKPSEKNLRIQELVEDGTIATKPWDLLLDKAYHAYGTPKTFHPEQDDGLNSLVPWMIKIGWEPYVSKRS